MLAGVNGAGKSSIGGVAFRGYGADYYNPDEAARTLRTRHSTLGPSEANAEAWQQGRRLLERAIVEQLDFALETTLGGNTIVRLLAEAAAKGAEIYIWYVGLSSPELHIARVQSRVRRGGHDIPERDIRRRYEHSRNRCNTLRNRSSSKKSSPNRRRRRDVWNPCEHARSRPRR